MAEIKKLIDSGGNQYFPQTSAKAVIDDNGNSVDSVLGMQTQLINQAQLEVGAVPSDATPTKDSSNWVTSGGLYNFLTIGNEDSDIDLNEYTPAQAFPNPTKWNCTSSYYGVFVPVVPGKKYRIVANADTYSFYGFLKTDTYSNNATVSYATGSTRRRIEAGAQTVDEAPSNARYLYICLSTTEDRTPQSVVECNKESLKDTIVSMIADMSILDYIVEIEESGFAICGENLNIIAKVDDKGLRAPNLLEYKIL